MATADGIWSLYVASQNIFNESYYYLDYIDEDLHLEKKWHQNDS